MHDLIASIIKKNKIFEEKKIDIYVCKIRNKTWITKSKMQTRNTTNYAQYEVHGSAPIVF